MSIVSEPEPHPLPDDEPDCLAQALPLTPERRLLCMVVRQLAIELLTAVGFDAERDGRRRATNHVRQIAMSLPRRLFRPDDEVAEAFGRDRTTVRHACRVVEDRRDDPAYDGFVAIVERIACAVVLVAGPRP